MSEHIHRARSIVAILQCLSFKAHPQTIKPVVRPPVLNDGTAKLVSVEANSRRERKAHCYSTKTVVNRLSNGVKRTRYIHKVTNTSRVPLDRPLQLSLRTEIHVNLGQS